MQMNQFKRAAISSALVAAAMAAGSAHAYEVTLDVAGIYSNGLLGTSGNETLFVDLFAGARITGISWDVTLFADAPSWLSEIGVDLNDGGSAGFSLFAGIGDYASGTQSYSGAADLVALAADFTLGASGRLNFEFFESFDDFPDDWDGLWQSGNLTVTYVPEPATFGLAALALLGLGLSSRRRST
jgi:hypothetical protein